MQEVGWAASSTVLPVAPPLPPDSPSLPPALAVLSEAPPLPPDPVSPTSVPPASASPVFAPLLSAGALELLAALDTVPPLVPEESLP